MVIAGTVTALPITKPPAPAGGWGVTDTRKLRPELGQGFPTRGMWPPGTLSNAETVGSHGTQREEARAAAGHQAMPGTGSLSPYKTVPQPRTWVRAGALQGSSPGSASAARDLGHSGRISDARLSSFSLSWFGLMLSEATLAVYRSANGQRHRVASERFLPGCFPGKGSCLCVSLRPHKRCLKSSVLPWLSLGLRGSDIVCTETQRGFGG